MWELLQALIIFMLMITVIIVGWVVALSLLLPLIKGPPYVPTSKRKVNSLMDMAPIRPGDLVANLGCGDGRFVLAAAQKGAHAYGYELNPLLVQYARWQIKRQNLEATAHIRLQDFWRVNLTEFDVIFIYGRWGMMRQLEQKIIRECQSGTRVLANTFDLPTLKPYSQQGDLFLYII